jgi:NADPH:quinone reductase-like Zn-dependent oxidoreductase
MQAIVQPRYGSPDVLELAELPAPVVADDEVLVRVRAAGVSISDWHFVTGTPYVLRPVAGPRKPKKAVPGFDLAGEVEAVGASVKDLGPGDEVFGWGDGSFAEYARTQADHVLRKPANLTFEQAAAVGDSAFTALAAVRDQAKVQPGQSVLVNGASGGVGTFAVQIATSFGAAVTGVCSTRNVDMVRSLGAHEVVDYSREDFTRRGQRYDVMLDMVGNRSLADCRRVLHPHGAYVLVGVAESGRWLGLGRQVRALASSPLVRQRMRVFVASRNPGDLAVLKDLVEAGKVTPVIDRSFGLREVPDAIRYQGEGHAAGKIVVTL